MLNFSCPKSYYLINNSNNTFVLTEDKTSYDIILTNGNYDVNTLKTELKTKLSGHSYSYDVAYDRRTNKYTFSVSNNLTQPYFNFLNSNTYLILGFEFKNYQFVADTLTSENVCYLQYTGSLLLCCDFVKGGILAQIVPNTSDFSYITYEENNPTFASHEVNRQDIKEGTFYLLDAKTQEQIDLNGIDFTFSFALYKKNVYFQSMLQDRKLQLELESINDRLEQLTET